MIRPLCTLKSHCFDVRNLRFSLSLSIPLFLFVCAPVVCAGNGSLSIFYSDPNVFFASLHADPSIEFPYTCGFSDQTGEGLGLGLKLNVPLPKGTTWKEYKPQLQRCVDEMKKFGAEALVVSLGTRRRTNNRTKK